MQPTLKLSAIVSGPNHRQYFDPQAMKKLLEEQKRAADDQSAAEREMGARAPTASQESSGIDFRRD